MNNSWADEIKKYTNLIRTMQNGIDAEEQRLGYHKSYERNDADLAIDGEKARAEIKLQKFIKKHANQKPTQMSWRDYISQIAARKRRAAIARKRATFKGNYDFWGKIKK